MTVRRLQHKDAQNLNEYLLPHSPECMFILSNLKAVGVEYHGLVYQGEYFGHFTDSKVDGVLDGVIVHYWNGNVMMYASNNAILGDLSHHLKRNLNRPIKGILGPYHQGILVIEQLGLLNATFKMHDREGLYDVDQERLRRLEVPGNIKIVQASKVSKDLLIQWIKDYEVEALGASTDSKNFQKNAKKRVDRILDNCWVLKHDGIPVSLSAFNARVDDVVQIGPVFTPKKHRNKGFARLLISNILTKNIKKTVLFTNNPAAIKAYQAVGFQKIGEYLLALI